MSKPASYPFMAIAKKYGLDYGDVLLLADSERHSYAGRDYRNVRICESHAYFRHYKKPEFQWIYSDIELANVDFRRIQAGEYDWDKGEWK